MPHLTKVEPKGLFETEVGPRPPERAHPPSIPYSADHEHRDERLSVGPDMTPDEVLFTRMSAWPRYNLLDIKNIQVRNRGKHY